MRILRSTQLHVEFQTTLGYMRPCTKQNKNKTTTKLNKTKLFQTNQMTATKAIYLGLNSLNMPTVHSEASTFFANTYSQINIGVL